jgi:hypothetical protein
MKAARDGGAAANLEEAKRLRQIAVTVSSVFAGLGLLVQSTKFAPRTWRMVGDARDAR